MKLFFYILMNITNVDVCFGCCWGDEGKGKVVAQLAKEGGYDFVCRWTGGNNAGHTVYVNGEKYKTHLIPSGVFYGVKSIIGQGCVVNMNAFQEEITYLEKNGFDVSLIKISPNAHIITEDHIEDDKQNYKHQGSTRRGIAPCYRDKYARIGKRVKDYDFFDKYLWDGKLYGNVLCEGSQGMWLDIDFGNYPYVTSSTTLPYGACSLGFPPQLINKVYGACKIYDTRVGTDPEFSEKLLENEDLYKLAVLGGEYGVATGRMRKTNWLNLDKLVDSINISGTTHLIISKIDIIQELGIYKLYNKGILVVYDNFEVMKKDIDEIIASKCTLISKVMYSGDPEIVDNLI
jgi:adenylosuccinate synthase